ncbi:MAG: DUF4040 domain-containing protein [Deltaproteobacteria bacterium]|nr:DUF4040 domain-containing protein [Deltaproteobacteria bacterium]MCX7952090.1 proton-conducting transporter membrane subunit [Deltaproteobacteria bacterium]
MRLVTTIIFILLGITSAILSLSSEFYFELVSFGDFWIDISVWNKNRPFLLLLGLCCVIVASFAHFYYKKKNFSWLNNFVLLCFAFNCFFIFAVTNLFSLLFFFELTNIFSYLLVRYSRHEKNIVSAKIVLLSTVISGLAFIFFSLRLYQIFSTADVVSLSNSEDFWNLDFQTQLAFLIAVVAKSAIFPFGYWLVAAMCAETPVSAFLHSATLVKLGLYIGFLFSNLVYQSFFSESLVWLGALSAVLYSYKAFYSNNLKISLAYTTLSSIGLMAYFLGSNDNASFSFYLVNHGLYKCVLFSLFGIMLIRTRLVSVDDFGKAFSRFEKMLILIPLITILGIKPAITEVVKANLVLDLFDQSKFFLTGFSNVVSLFFLTGFGMRLIISLVSKKSERVSTLGTNCLLVGVIVLVLGQFQSLNLSPERPTEFGDLPRLLEIFILLGGSVLALSHPTYDLTPYYFDHINKCMRMLFVIFHKFFQPQKLNYYLVLFFVSILTFGAIVKTSLFLEGLTLRITLTLCLFLSLVTVGTFLVVRSQSRLMTVLSVALLSLAGNLAFLLYGAPDLALTSFFVDMLWLGLIAVSLSKLPPFKIVPKIKFQTGRFIVATLFGAMMFILSLEQNLAESRVKEDYLAYAYPILKAENVVNAIVVGFRGFDTLGEITVLGLCALGLSLLLKTR